MNAADLAAIRERNEARKKGSCYDCGHAHDDSDARLDIDALFAEVERLLAADEVRARDISRLTEERDGAREAVARLCTVSAAVDALEQLHGGANDERKCSSAEESCAIGDVIAIIRRRAAEPQ